jgi:hypothetical protein
MITFHNQFWAKGVNIEIHFGDSAGPHATPSTWIRQIAYQARWRVCATANLRYRRDLNPDNPDGQMTGWTMVQGVGTDWTENV